MILNTIIQKDETPTPPPPVFEPETWVIKNKWTPKLSSTTIKFKSNNKTFSTISTSIDEVRQTVAGDWGQTCYLKYGSTEVSERYRFAEVYSDVGNASWGRTNWSNSTYNTITFTEESPSGDLLTWLQANATKQ